MEEYVASFLRGVAGSYTTSAEILSRNKTFFTQKITRDPYVPSAVRLAATEAAVEAKADPETKTQTSKTKPVEKSKPKISPVAVSSLHTAAAALSMVPEAAWTADTHRANIDAYSLSDTPPPNPKNLSADAAKALKKQQGAQKRELYTYLRWALTGGDSGGGIPNTMEVLGREETLRRFKEAKEATDHLREDGGSQGKRRFRGEQGKGGQPDSKEWMGSLAGVGN